MPGVGLLFGPMLIGVYLNTILYGVLVVQTFIYYQTYKNDKPWIRYLILYLFILETLNTGFDIGMMYEPLIVRYATPRATIVAPIMLSADPIATVMISTPVQLFIAWRINIITKSRLTAGIVSFFSICAFIGGIATTISVTLIPEYARLHEFDGAVITWLASSAAADIVITSSLVISLYRRKTGVRATDDVINRIIRLSVQTGMITAISAAADVIIFVVVPNTTLNFVWDFALSKLYTNSLLSTLNARAGWNNLTGSDQHNVLFGDDHNNTMIRTMKSSERSKSSNPQKIVTGVYELEPHRSSAQSSSALDSSAKNDGDLEHGVNITRIVHQFEDPLPTNKKDDAD
ncbi:hypothetical protein BDN71DRAFT_1592778 [Pleurotus eryngii]|uniref:DUF6534 domain-containing protein n=1 Tax=Pleurotus eryngii TaxID=5323 RepID=A0A9P5ZNH6_PLEER|nr:hypothetical protein BDN71DRAFT_1592778 [Pleurotus eryngii]